ncbi:MAG: low molecular weight phosphotyrosine protein phosphatase [Bacteroidetes bacterium]|nr:low molecular weight phosphotyrosine protein phosphatase [Bacteroidota bacterium]MBS1670599.1 low molecular weight phosphotyrosine protein phosphatase [Bacteroidota bacterium]
MVCLGNICRSPLAEGILRNKVEEAGLNWVVDSAGTANYHVGEPPHHLSQKIAKLHGIDISQHKGRQFVKEDFERFDFIYVMDEDNYADVKTIAKNYFTEKKIDLILNASFPNQNKNVPDPWYGTEEGYHKVYDMLNKACEVIIKRKW